jgi:glycosyltransferase involved in cell wall biosynthesis
MKLSIVIPAYNEEMRLRPMMDVYTEYFTARYGNDVELIVVVNGSIDQTENIARSYSERFPQVRTLVEPRAIGKGGAIMMGFAAATGEWIGFVDADGSTQPPAFQDLMDRNDVGDVIIASRWLPESKVSPRQPLKRRIASRVFNLLVNTFFGLRLTDTQCGAKLIRGEALKIVLPRLGLTRWAFDVDLLFQLHRAGFEINEVATTWQDIGGSKLKVGKVSLEMFLAICRLRLLYSPFRWVIGLYDISIGRLIHLKAES